MYKLARWKIWPEQVPFFSCINLISLDPRHTTLLAFCYHKEICVTQYGFMSDQIGVPNRAHESIVVSFLPALSKISNPNNGHQGSKSKSDVGVCLTDIELSFVSKSEEHTTLFCVNFHHPNALSKRSGPNSQIWQTRWCGPLPPTHVTSSKNGIEQQWSSWIWDVLSHPPLNPLRSSTGPGKQHSSEELDTTLEIRFTLYSIIRLYKSFSSSTRSSIWTITLLDWLFIRVLGYVRFKMIKWYHVVNKDYALW